MDRLRSLTHRGKHVLMADCSGCNPDQLIALFDEVEELVAQESGRTLLIIADFTGAQFNKQAADRMKVVAAKDRAHVHRAALVGAEAIGEVYLREMESFSARKFLAFSTREEALDWLVSEQAAAS
jgi:dihydroxyacetone kinase DhaKLM complex PTS-EIIA-like component DhaM